MRFLLIIGLLFASITMAAPAQATGAAGDCHAMEMDGGAGAHGGDQNSDPSDTLRAMHSCPGCAFVFATDEPGRAKPVAAIPQPESFLTRHPSNREAPTPPPPQN